MGVQRTARLELVAAAALFSTGGAAIKACSLTGWQIACFRSGLAALTFLLILPRAKERWTRGSALVGVGYAATMVLFVLANKLTTAANSIFLQSAAPLYILLLGPWLLRERIKRKDLAYLAAVALGLALFFVDVNEPLASAPDPVRGNVLGLLSGVGWALTVVGLRWLGVRAEGGVGAIVAGNVLACAVCLPNAFPMPAVAIKDLAVVAYLGVFQIALAYLLVTRAIRHLEAFEVSVFLLVEPVLNPVWAWLVHGEIPGAWSLVGGVLIVVATAARTWRDAQEIAVVPPP